MFQSKHSIRPFTPLKEELSCGSDQSIDHHHDNENNNNVMNNCQLNCQKSSSMKSDKSTIDIVIITDNNNDRIDKEKLTKKDQSSGSSSGLTLKVIIGAFVVIFTNSFPSGYNIGVLNLPEQVLKNFFNISLSNNNGTNTIATNNIELIWSLAVSILVIGAMITSIITGYLANHFGRRVVIFLNIMLGLIAMCLTWGSKYLTSVSLFMLGRLIAGFHTGIASSIVPMYLMEISPKTSASLFGTLHVMALNGGLCFAQIMGLESVFGAAKSWQLLFFVNAMFITVGMIGFFFMPESPVYLFVIKRREDSAVRVLEKIRKHPMEVAEDIANLRREQKCEEGSNNSLLSLLKQYQFRKGLLIVCLLHAGQQLVGINAVFYYSTNTFRSVGLTPIQSQYGSIGCSFLNTLCAILSSRLLKSFSSRTMLLVSTIGTTIALSILPISMSFNDEYQWLNFVTISMTFFYVFMFAIGQGPIPFMIGGQLFDSSSMSTGLSMGVFINWFCNSLVAFAFPLLVIHINQLVFIIFLAFDIILLLIIIFLVPKSNENDNEIGKKPLDNSISE